MEVPEKPRVIAGRYALESLIGEGGTASVWRARDLTLERLVAVKLLFSRDERDRNRLVEQFLREARIAASVHHRNVINIVDFGSTDGGHPYMVMELLEGETLGQRLQRDPPLRIDEAIQVALLTLRGLTAVHEAGIIHRDLKPDNVFLARDAAGGVFPKILDFGISRSIEPRSGRRSALTTREGMIVGTPEYMSPEQARGVRSIDRRSDIYSMGAILYQSLTGELAFANENVGDLIIQIVTGALEPVHALNPSVPRGISDIVSKAMARKPEDRFQDATAMQQALLREAEVWLGPAAARFSDLPPTFSLTQSGELPVPVRRASTLEFPMEDEPPAPSESAALPLPLPPKVPSGVSTPAQRSRRAFAIGAVLSLAAFGVSFYAATRHREGEARASAAEAAGAISRARNGKAKEQPLPTTIKVELRGVPKDGSISVDGMPYTGNVLELARDQRNRVIRVSAPGKVPWQAVHHASANASYDVWLAELEPVSAKASPRAASAARNKVRKKPPSALRRLDF